MTRLVFLNLPINPIQCRVTSPFALCTHELFVSHISLCMFPRTYIRIYQMAFRCTLATRPIQSRPNRKMSRNVGNWKAYSYFFDTRTHAPGNARYRGSRPYFHFACLTRGAQPSASASPRQGMRKGGECRKGAGCRGDRGVEQEKREAVDCAGKCKLGMIP